MFFIQVFAYVIKLEIEGEHRNCTDDSKETVKVLAVERKDRNSVVSEIKNKTSEMMEHGVRFNFLNFVLYYKNNHSENNQFVFFLQKFYKFTMIFVNKSLCSFPMQDKHR